MFEQLIVERGYYNGSEYFEIAIFARKHKNSDPYKN